MNQNKMAEIMVEQDLSVRDKTSKKKKKKEKCSIYEITCSDLKNECNYFCKR